jgi:hypothetical protein
VGDSGTVTRLLLPLNDSAAPYRPLAFQVAPEMVPLLLFPETSCTTVPLPSLNP